MTIASARPESRETATGQVPSARVGWLLVAVTALLLLAIVLSVLVRGQSLSPDGVTTDTGARFTGLVLAAILLIPLTLHRLSIRIPRITYWIGGAISLMLVAAMWVLGGMGSDYAWALYGGLQVLRAGEGFNDLNWIAEWLNCGLCTEWDPNYGAGFDLLGPLTEGRIPGPAVTVIGFSLATALTVVLVRVGQKSHGRGGLIALIAMVSPAWLLLLDRANIDAVILLAFVLGVWLIHRRPTLVTWSIFALIIWIVGTLKYYPFALGIALLPAVRLRHGWLIVAGYAAATAAFFAAVWGRLAGTVGGLEQMSVLFDFPVYGRVVVVDRMVGLWSEGARINIANATLFALALVCVAWGWTWAQGLNTRSTVIPLLGLGGSVAFLSAVLLAGFTYMYKGGFLVLLLPLLSLPRRSKSRFSLYTSVVALTGTGVALIAAYQPLLTTLVGTVAASIALGAALRLILRGGSRSASQTPVYPRGT